jgi:folate-binding protein YgfZ
MDTRSMENSRLIIRGPDARSFLHRISTNSVVDQKAGESCENVLVDAKGRMVEWFHQLMLGDNEILLIASGIRGAELIAWFDQFLFTEDLEIIDLTATSTLAWQAGSPSSTSDWLVIPSRHSHYLFSHAVREVTSTISREDYECWRIAQAIPAYRNEINSSFSPLEIGLRDAIHWAKGCYIGQEVISKMETYQKQRKHLVPIGCSEAEFSQLHLDKTITSIAPRYTPGKVVALAVRKTSIDSERAQP